MFTGDLQFCPGDCLPDGTRIIFNASNKSATVRLTNQSKIDPYLAQSWIEDASGKNAWLHINTAADGTY